MLSFYDFWNFSTFTQAQRQRPALSRPGHPDITYGQLDDMAEHWAARLTSAAKGRRPMIGLELTTEVDSVAAYLGALRSGLPLLVVEAGQLAAQSRIRQIWQPELCLTAGDAGPELTDTVAVGPVSDATLAEPDPELRLLLSTSGSTGDPKLVRLSGDNIASNAAAIAEYLKVTETDRAVTTLPFYYSYGLSVLNSYLAAGASLLLSDRSVTEPEFWEEARAAGVTSLAMVPHQFDLLEHMGFTGKELPSLRYATQAGGKLAPNAVRHFDTAARENGWELVVMYGQTEAAPRISYVPAEALSTAFDTIGQAVPGGRIWLADENGAEITGTGQPGELVYEGPNVMMGYASERADLARGREHADLRTGDIAERTEAGYFRIVGRMKRFVKLFGLRLSLDQIEALLHDRGLVANAVAVDDHLVLLHRDPARGAEIAQALSAAYDLPEDAVCTAPLTELPLLSSGKPDQKALSAIAAEVLAETLAARKSAQASESLAEVLKRATRAKVVHPEDSFTSLGGDSLSYLQVQMVLEDRMGTPPEGWENLPLAELDRQVAAAAGQRGNQTGSRTHLNVGMDVLLRLAAISLVVAQHASDYALYGGTWILLTLMGFSAARFQSRLISTNQPFKLGTVMLYPIVPLYMALLLAYSTLRDEVPLSFALLVGNYHVTKESSLLTVYWFISLYAQLVFGLMLMTALPVTRRLLDQAPWKTFAVICAVLGAVGFALVMQDGYVYANERVSHLADFPVTHITGRSLIETIPFFALGWMIATVKSRQEIALTVLLAAITLFNFSGMGIGSESIVYLTIAFCLLLSEIKVRLPVKLGRILQQMAAATLFVYLLHQVLVTVFRYWLELPDALAVPTSLVSSYLVALGAKWAFESAERLVLSLPIFGATAKTERPV